LSTSEAACGNFVSAGDEYPPAIISAFTLIYKAARTPAE